MKRRLYIIGISVASVLAFSALAQDAANIKAPDAPNSKVIQPDAPKVAAPSDDTGIKVGDRDKDRDHDKDRDGGTTTNVTSGATNQPSK